MFSTAAHQFFVDFWEVIHRLLLKVAVKISSVECQFNYSCMFNVQL